jgi:hypothetical protein
MEFEQYEQKLTTEELAAFEQQYNITLPKAFKEHYLQYNGGYPPYENVKGTKHLFTINSFYPIKLRCTSYRENHKRLRKERYCFR